MITTTTKFFSSIESLIGYHFFSLTDQTLFHNTLVEINQVILNSRLIKNNEAIKYSLALLSNFIESEKISKKLRGFTSGFISSNDYLCCNLYKLSSILRCCKSKIRTYLAANHTIILPPIEAELILSKTFKDIPLFPSESRQWSVRTINPTYKQSLTTSCLQTEIGINFITISQTLISTPNLSELMSQLQILPMEVICSNCNIKMVQRTSPQSQLDFHWRCTKCCKTKPASFQTIFHNTRSKSIQLLLILYCFSRDYNLKETEFETGLDIKTIEEVFTELRLMIHSIYTDQQQQKLIGGQDMNVQIHETYISIRKYNVG
jgi:hypothetical protein